MKRLETLFFVVTQIKKIVSFLKSATGNCKKHVVRKECIGNNKTAFCQRKKIESHF